MAWICDHCGKGYQRGHRVSHAKNRSLRRFMPNLHFKRVLEGDRVVRRRLCTRCLKRAVKPGKKSATVARKESGYVATSL